MDTKKKSRIEDNNTHVSWVSPKTFGRKPKLKLCSQPDHHNWKSFLDTKTVYSHEISRMNLKQVTPKNKKCEQECTASKFTIKIVNVLKILNKNEWFKIGSETFV
jgi:hypothetical protein